MNGINGIDVVIGLLIGMFATYIMDLTNIFFSKLDIVEFVGPQPLGRMAHGWLKGIFMYENIFTAQEVANESLKGRIAHYLIGGILSLILSFIIIFFNIRSNIVLISICYGVLTTAFSWFLVFPSTGFGIMGAKAPNGLRMGTTSLISHIGYGIGLALGFILLKYLFILLQKSNLVHNALLYTKT